MKRYFGIISDIHLYVGLFISPFIIVFSVSAIILNHNFIDWQEDWQEWTFSVDETVDETMEFSLPSSQASKIDFARDIISQLNIKGEISNIFGDSATMYIPVTKPGHRISIRADINSGIAYIHREETGFLQQLVWLHTMPGPHNASIRGNWVYTNFWRLFTDFSVICLFLSSITGIILWFYLKNERIIGLIALLIGAVSFVSLLIGLMV